MKFPHRQRATERNVMASGVHKVDISWDRRAGGTVANVVFDNSRKLNSLNPPALLDLTEAFLGLAREDDLRVVVLSGAGGKAFIGGGGPQPQAADAETAARAAS